MKIEKQRFTNLEKFKWKYAEYANIAESNVTDKDFSKWLQVSQKYYSNWKNDNKFMSSRSARKLEQILGLTKFTLDTLHIQDDIYTDFQQQCFHLVRTYMAENTVKIDPRTEINIANQLFKNGKNNGLKISKELFTNLVSIL